MKKHMPLIIMTSVILVTLLALHFTLFGPMRTEYNDTMGKLDQGVNKLKEQITSVEWNIEQPDPRDPSFTWEGLLDKVKGNFDGKKMAYETLVEDIDISIPADDPEKSQELVLARLGALQELEKKNGRVLEVSEKWGLNTWSDKGHNGTRPLDLRRGGYRSYAGERRIEGEKGTIQFALNIASWIKTDEEIKAEIDALQGNQQQQQAPPSSEVVFHAGHIKPPAEDAPKGAPTEYSSEIKVQRDGNNLGILIVRRDGMQEFSQPYNLNISDWLRKETSGNPWKVLRMTWGPTITDMNAYVDGKTANEFNMTVRTQAAGGVPGMGGMMGGGMMGMMGGYGGMMGMMRGYGGEGGGMAGFGGGAMRDPNAGVSLETIDGFCIGADLNYKNNAKVMVDSFRIWNSVAKSGEPQSEPLFAEDFESPFGSDNELKRSVDQLVRFYRDTYDPNNGESVQKQNKAWYDYLIGFWGSSPGMTGSVPEWITTMKTLAFLDHGAKTIAKSGDPERLANDIGITVPEHEQRRHVATFLDLCFEMADTLVKSQVDKVDQIDFLTWSNTVNDEPLKVAYKEAFDQLETDIGATGGMMKGPMGMMGGPMGMMGMMGGPMGMMGGPMGMMGGPMGGPMGYGGMYGPPGMMMQAPGEEAADPEALKEAQRQREEMMNQRMKEYEEQMEKMQKYEENLAKWKRWLEYNKKNEIPPEFYTDFQSQMASAGKDFFLRYSVQTIFECSKDRLAPTLHALEFGKRLAFISKVRLNPVPETTNMVHAVVNIEFNFMKSSLTEPAAPVEGEPGAVPAEGELQTSEAAGTSG